MIQTLGQEQERSSIRIARMRDLEAHLPPQMGGAYI